MRILRPKLLNGYSEQNLDGKIRAKWTKHHVYSQKAGNISLAQTICESLVFFFVSSEQVNLIRWFLCDDTLQQFKNLHAIYTVFVLTTTASRANIWYQCNAFKAPHCGLCYSLRVFSKGMLLYMVIQC